MSDRAAIRMEELCKRHSRGGRVTEVLHNLNLTIAEGEFVAIMGPSGSGKTSLLNLIGGLEKPSSGRIDVRGREPGRMSGAELAAWHANEVGFVFQFYNLIPVLTARENVELPLALLKVPKAMRRSRTDGALQLVGLQDRAQHRPMEMSGGEQQRVAIARAIIASPWLLLCDEPTGDLDRETAEDIMQLIEILSQDHGVTVVLVTHDPKVAARAHRTIYLDKGSVQSSEASAVA